MDTPLCQNNQKNLMSLWKFNMFLVYLGPGPILSPLVLRLHVLGGAFSPRSFCKVRELHLKKTAAIWSANKNPRLITSEAQKGTFNKNTEPLSSEHKVDERNPANQLRLVVEIPFFTRF